MLRAKADPDALEELGDVRTRHREHPRLDLRAVVVAVEPLVGHREVKHGHGGRGTFYVVDQVAEDVAPLQDQAIEPILPARTHLAVQTLADYARRDEQQREPVPLLDSTSRLIEACANIFVGVGLQGLEVRLRPGQATPEIGHRDDVVAVFAGRIRAGAVLALNHVDEALLVVHEDGIDVHVARCANQALESALLLAGQVRQHEPQDERVVVRQLRVPAADVADLLLQVVDRGIASHRSSPAG